MKMRTNILPQSAIITMAVLISILLHSPSHGQKPDSDLRKAAKKGDISKVLAYISQGASINSKDKKGKTALMFAAEEGHVDIVEALLEKGVDVTTVDKKGESALDKAIKKRRSSVIRVLESAEAKTKDTIEAYEQFLSKYPDTESSTEFTRRIRELEWKADYSESKKINTLGSYEHFLSKYDSPKDSVEFKALIKNKQEELRKYIPRIDSLITGTIAKYNLKYTQNGAPPSIKKAATQARHIIDSINKEYSASNVSSKTFKNQDVYEQEVTIENEEISNYMISGQIINAYSTLGRTIFKGMIVTNIHIKTESFEAVLHAIVPRINHVPGIIFYCQGGRAYFHGDGEFVYATDDIDELFQSKNWNFVDLDKNN